MWGSVGKVPAAATGESEFEPQNPYNKPGVVASRVTPVMERWRQADPWDLLARQPSLISKLQSETVSKGLGAGQFLTDAIKG